MSTYDVGDEIQLVADFSNLSDVPTDPGTVVCKLRDPGGTETTPTVSNDPGAVGRFTVDVPITLPGVWVYRFEGTGLFSAVEEGSFTARATHLAATPVLQWITLDDAVNLTGVSFSQALLNAAAQEIYDEIRWRPVYTLDLVATAEEGNTLQGEALGRAIAWQAAYRSETPATANDVDGVRIQAEKLKDYSVTYAGAGRLASGAGGSGISERARKLLRQYGLYRMAGKSVANLIDDHYGSILRVN